MRFQRCCRFFKCAIIAPSVFLLALPAAGQAQVKTLVVMIQETNLGQVQNPPIVENAVITKLVGAGYQVADPEKVRELDEKARLRLLLENDLNTIKAIADRFSANLLVIGKALSESSQDTQGIVSARARVSLRVVEAETGRILVNREVGDVRGFDLAADRAGQKALRAAGEKMAEYVLEQLNQHKEKDQTTDVRANQPDRELHDRAGQVEPIQSKDEVER